MAYAGLPPATFTNNLTNVQLIDDISGSFNGSTQTLALTSSSAPFHAVLDVIQRQKAELAALTARVAALEGGN